MLVSSTRRAAGAGPLHPHWGLTPQTPACDAGGGDAPGGEGLISTHTMGVGAPSTNSGEWACRPLVGGVAYAASGRGLAPDNPVGA
ncbi:MAG: hypothetical protein MUD01_12845 [Chloroflexaceae bacterium]|nr:hypothetical protein [Chloroflexaceae bacterium]